MSRPNVLFLVMDTARFSNVFEKSPAVMPGLQEFSNEGTVFGRAMATAPWTVPSHGSMFTGQYPSDHGAHAGTKQFDPGGPVLAELFQQAGYQTAAFSNNTWLSPEFGFAKGFESFHVRWELFEGGADLSAVAKADNRREQIQHTIELLSSRNISKTLLNLLYAAYLSYTSSQYDSGADRTNRRLLDWLQSKDEQPFFAFVNYVEPHLPYEPSEDFRYEFLPDGMNRERLDSVNQDPWRYLAGEIEMTEKDFEALEALYNAELRYLDKRLSELFEFLAQEGELDETVVVVVGDHGENLGEHGLMDHQYCLYDTLLHVPLLVRYPPAFPEDVVIEELVELRDIFPTLLDVAGIEATDLPVEVSDHSLLDPISEGIGREYTIGEYMAPQPSMNTLSQKLGVEKELPASFEAYDRALRSYRTPEWKYIEGSENTQELYHLTSDPDEETNVADEYPEITKTLAKQLSEDRGSFKVTDNSEVAMSRMTQQRLEDLGYLQ